MREDIKPTEQNPENAAVNTPEGNAPEKEEPKTPTVEELMAELAKERAERAKLKNAFDKTSSEAATYKKALREKQTAEEVKAEEDQKAKEEHERQFAELVAFKREAEAKSRYALQGMDEKLASEAAKAEVAGDYDQLAKIQKQFAENLVKAREAEWMKTRPVPNGGNGDEESADPFLKGFNSVPTRF